MEKTATTLWFEKDAEAAATHYVKGIPGSKIISVERFGKQGPGPEGTAMLVSIEFAGRPFMLMNCAPLFTLNESVSFTIYAEDQMEVDFLWAHMSEGGTTSRCGWLKDRWGFSWQIVPKRFVELMTKSSPDVKGKVFDAMMQMTKLDIAKLEAVAKG